MRKTNQPKHANPARPIRPAPEPTLPDWATETPVIKYTLEAYVEEVAQSIERADITREEYVALKEHLVKMRGLAKPRSSAA